jgi:hypothetical protein
VLGGGFIEGLRQVEEGAVLRVAWARPGGGLNRDAACRNSGNLHTSMSEVAEVQALKEGRNAVLTRTASPGKAAGRSEEGCDLAQKAESSTPHCMPSCMPAG